MEKARAAGTAAEILQQAVSQEFLHACLKKTNLDADLVSDLTDACELNEVDALILGGGELSEAEAADKLFLMPEEASSVLGVCRRECLRIGVSFGDGAVYEPLPEDENVDPEPVPSPKADSPVRSPVAKSAIASVSPTSPAVFPVASPSTASARTAAATPTHSHHHGSHHRTARVSHEHGTHDSSSHDNDDPFMGHTLMKTPAHFPTHHLSKSPTKKSGGKSPTKKPGGNIAKPHSHSASKSVPSNTRPASAKPSVRAGVHASACGGSPATNGTKSPAKRPKPLVRRPASASHATPLPSFSRSTASLQVRQQTGHGPTSTQNEHSVEPRLATPPLQKAVSPVGESPAPKKERTPPQFANLSASLLRPTKAFLAWTGSNKENDNKENEKQANRALVTSQSTKLNLSTRGPIAVNGGSRNLTPSAAPKQRTLTQLKAAKANGQPLTSEEMEYLKAQEESGGGFKARPMPRYLSRTFSTPVAANGAPTNGRRSSVSASKASSARANGTVHRSTSLSLQPFHLASADRHKKSQEEFTKKVEEKRRDGGALMSKQFKATPLQSQRAKSANTSGSGGFTVFAGPAK